MLNLKTARYPLDLVSADLNGDVKLDIAVSDWTAQDVLVFLEKSQQGFHPYLAYAVEAEPWGLAVADFNGDGKLDLATALPNGGLDSVVIIFQQ